ncbi:reverse transcriptase domain-containing protein [Trichonephila clavipes]|nr:reverse transcriptase domain-containing protein [Trichonephila clavipes]
MLDTCLYVDDVISGADDISQALKVSKDAETIMKNASMKLRKWNSNDQTLMRTWEKEGLETHPRHPDDSSKIPSSKVLGIPWDVVHDYFTIDVKGLLQSDTSKPITKELCFNQLGKYTIQLSSCHPTQLGSNAYYKNFGYGSYPGMTSYRQIFMHQKAYGAAAFLRVKHKDRVSVDLVTSKSRVAPLKRLSLPRLELMGALLAARLAKEVKKNPRSEVFNQSLFFGRTLRSPYIGSKVQAIDGNPLLRTGGFRRDMEALMELRASWTSMGRTPTGFKQHRKINRTTNYSAFMSISGTPDSEISKHSAKTFLELREKHHQRLLTCRAARSRILRRIAFVICTKRSHQDADGGLNFHRIFSSATLARMLSQSKACRSIPAPLKFVPLSEYMAVGCPRGEIKRLSD